MVAEILLNLGVLAVAALLLFAIGSRLEVDESSRRYQVSIGVVFGCVAAVVSFFPYVLPYGGVIDGRAGPIVLAGLYGGPIGGVIASVFCAMARLAVGGAVVYGGVASCFVLAAMGIAAHFLYARRWRRAPGAVDLICIGAVSTLSLVPLFFTALGPENSAHALAEAWLPMAVSYIGSVVLLGVVYEEVRRARRRTRDLERSLKISAMARNSAKIGVWRYQFATERIEWDPIMFDLFDRDPDDFSFDIGYFFACLHPDDLDQVRDDFYRAGSEGQEFSNSYRILDRSGSVRHLQARAHFLRDDDGRAHEAIGVVWDISEEVRSQERLRLADNAMNASVNGILIAQAGGGMEIVNANAAFTRITGYTFDEVRGRNLGFLAGPEPEQPGLNDLRSALSRDEACSVLVRHYRRDGTPFWDQLSVSPMRDDAGAITHYVCILENKTAEVEAEENARAHQDRLEAILSSAPDAIITVDENLTVTDFNAAAEQLFGWPRDEILGKSINVLVPVEVAGEHLRQASGFMQGSDEGARVMADWRNIEGRRADGSTFPVLVTLSRFRIAGRPTVTAIARDMTSIARMNQELFRMSNELVHQLEEARAADEAKTRFLASMSHELRTPLNAILGFSSAMKGEMFGPLGSPKYGEYLSDIHDSGNHLLSLINDLLDLTAIEKEQFTIHLDAMSPTQIVEDAAKAVRSLVNAKSLQLTQEIDASLPMVAADKRAIHQCLLNLLSNAIKFTEPSGHVRVGACRDDAGHVVLWVGDDGVGIPEDEIEKIGHPFVQVGDPMRAETKGTGLGLAITKGLIEKMNGEFCIESEHRVGTTVRLCLPPISQPHGEGEEEMRA